MKKKLWFGVEFIIACRGVPSAMKPPRAHARGILHFFGEIRRSTLLRSSSFGGSYLRIHPRAYARGLLRRRINYFRYLFFAATWALKSLEYITIPSAVVKKNQYSFCCGKSTALMLAKLGLEIGPGGRPA